MATLEQQHSNDVYLENINDAKSVAFGNALTEINNTETNEYPDDPELKEAEKTINGLLDTIYSAIRNGTEETTNLDYIIIPNFDSVKIGNITKQITKLTPKLAARLVRAISILNLEDLNLPNLKTIDKYVANELSRSSCDYLNLGLTSIDSDSARELARFSGKYLFLNDLQGLDSTAAEELISFGGEILRLDGLTSIDSASAEILCKYNGNLQLSRITSIDSEVARKLSEKKGGLLHLGGLTSIDSDSARELAKINCDKLILGLISIDQKVARELSQSNCKNLCLNSLENIDVNIAKELAKFKGNELDLRNINDIDEETAYELAKYQGSLTVNYHSNSEELVESAKKKLNDSKNNKPSSSEVDHSGIGMHKEIDKNGNAIFVYWTPPASIKSYY